MKSLKQVLFITFTFIFILSSCKMEKRLYRSGYHVTGKKSKHAVESSDNASTKPNNRANKKNEIAGVISINENTIVDSTKLNEKNITASTDNSIFIPASETS